MKKFLNSIVNYYKRTDKILILLCCFCSIFSCLVLYSISQYFFTSSRIFLVQCFASLFGIFIAIFISKVDYHMMVNFNKYHAILCWSFVLITFIIGAQRDGADDKAWIMLPFNLSFQPTEIAKFSFILTFAAHLNKVKNEINEPKNLFFLCLHGAIPVLIIHFQGDDGTALIFFFIFLVMCFVAGVAIKYFVFLVSMIIIASPVIWYFVFSEHQRLRFLTIFVPELDKGGIGYQAYQGKVSIGSGGIWGKGLFSGTHRKIPEMQNDFIFAYIGETLGFIGCLAVILLLVFICFKIFLNAKFSNDSLGMFICCGISSVFIFQMILNIGMCLSLMPVIGVTLPFFSAGGTSIISLYIGIGIVLSVHIHNKDIFFL